MAHALPIRRLPASEAPAALAILRELRNHVSEAELERRLHVQLSAGYELVGAFLENRLVAVLGMRTVLTLARGPHLHVDDLVVTASCRRKGLGSTLLRWAEHDARCRGLASVFLDSRPEVQGFYAAIGYEPHSAVLVRKRL